MITPVRQRWDDERDGNHPCDHDGWFRRVYTIPTLGDVEFWTEIVGGSRVLRKNESQGKEKKKIDQALVTTASA